MLFNLSHNIQKKIASCFPPPILFKATDARLDNIQKKIAREHGRRGEKMSQVVMADNIQKKIAS